LITSEVLYQLSYIVVWLYSAVFANRAATLRSSVEHVWNLWRQQRTASHRAWYRRTPAQLCREDRGDKTYPWWVKTLRGSNARELVA
jgi:hypothetical protein